MAQSFRITGVVIEKGTKRPLPGLLVQASDQDHLYDDRLATVTTDQSGRFELHYAGEEYRELFEKRPEIFLRVLDASGSEIYCTEDPVRWNAGTDEEVTIEVPAGNVPDPVVADVPVVPIDNRRDGSSFHPYLCPTSVEQKLAPEIKVSRADHPRPRLTLGDLRGLAAEVTGPEDFEPTILVHPFEPTALTGIDPTTVRVFRWDEKSGGFEPVWNSGINYTLGFTWAEITSPGTYLPLGLPRDRLLRELLRTMARERIYRTSVSRSRTFSFLRERFNLFGGERAEEFERARQFLTTLELQTGAGAYTQADIRVGRGGHALPFPLPGDATPKEFGERLAKLDVTDAGLPEEALFFTPEMSLERDGAWTLSPGSRPLWERVDLRALDDLALREDILELLPGLRLVGPNWWMYHHDEMHGGRASGFSEITTTTASSMILHHTVPLPDGGSVVTIPSIVDDKIYVGTYRRFGATGNEGLYRIDLHTGTVEDHFPVPLLGSVYADGIGGSPALVGGRVYFSHMPGEVYCIDAADFSQVYWQISFRVPNEEKKQPVRNPQADCFTSPLVVNGKVYVGCGEGENNALGFIYCLDATNGRVIWLFCTCQLPAIDATGAVLPDVEVQNNPNVIPASAAVSNPLPAWATSAGFSTGPNPLHRGASVWSSCAYDRPLNRIYAGTGNITGDNGLPDDKYGSGVISLDADTGAFRGFLSPAQATSYRPDDLDVDVPAGPTVFRRGSERFVAIGSKNGSFFLLNPETMTIVRERQLLPKDAVTGARIDSVDPHSFPENKWGVMGTAAVHSGLGILYVGLGGYDGIDDFRVTPFLRALNWETLDDAWTTHVDPVGSNQVSRYMTARPPLYTNPGEAGLSSPAVVNDVVFVSTSTPFRPSPPSPAKANLYALNAATGLCLWAAPTISTSGEYPYCLGPAIYGNYVVIGAGNRIYIYVLSRLPPWARYEPPLLIDPRWRFIKKWPWPPPPPDFGLEDLLRDAAQGKKI
jgi:outer membrane protein assembly factor BamB